MIPDQFRRCAVILVMTLATGCSGDPTSMLPPGERVLLQQEAANERAAKPVSVDDMLARARGVSKTARPEASPLVLHIIEAKDGLRLPPADLAELAAIPPDAHEAILRVGPAQGMTPLAATLAASRRAKFITEKLPPTLHLAETRYDIALAPDTAQLDFGGADLAH